MKKKINYFWFIMAALIAFIFLSCFQEKEEDNYRTVKYDLNGGDGITPEPKTVYKGYIVVLNDGNGLINPPLAFECWNTKPDGSGTDYNRGKQINLHDNLTLYVKWSLPTVTFDINGGEGTIPEAQTVEVGTQIRLPLRGDLNKAGFEYGGWSASRSDTGTSFSAGSWYTVKDHITLYARWNTIYYINYDAGGGTGTPPEPQQVASGGSIILRNNTFFTNGTRSFWGWYSRDVNVIGGDTNILQPGTTVRNIHKNLTFTARWWF